MAGFTATVFGSSGLTGQALLGFLIADHRFEKIILFNRKPSGIRDPRLEEHITQFEAAGSWEQKIKGDFIFCCLGTTIAKAGSQDAFRMVDFELPVNISKAAALNKVRSMLVMSSLGANPLSRNFYLRTKGEMEQAIRKSGIDQVYFFRPSMLLGQRTESRPAEIVGKIVMKAVSFLFVGPLKKYLAIHVQTVARAMIRVATEEGHTNIIESDQIAILGK